MTQATILLVEDDANDEALTLRALKKHEVLIDVIVARDGAEALDRLFGQGSFAGVGAMELPSLILLDLKLPKVDGLEVLKQIREDARTRLLPVIIFTSSDEQRDRLAGYESGANSFIRKPVEFNEFIHAVQQLGVYWLILNQPPPVRH